MTGAASSPVSLSLDVALAVVVGVLVLRSLAGEWLVPADWYVPVNLAVAAVLVLVAWWVGLVPADLGLARARVPAGLALGGAIAVVLVAGIGLGAVLPWTRSLFEDQRIAGVEGAGQLAVQALVRVPLGTAVLEEVAFRGVLLALVTARHSTGVAVAVSSVLFGLWHIHPTLDALAANELAAGVPARAGLVTAAVVVTGVVGAGFCALRLESGSLLAPFVVHATSNSAATAAAYVVLRSS